MALRWLLGIATTQIVGQTPGECSKEAAEKEKEKAVAEVKIASKGGGEGFRMPVHYPRYKKEDYEKMEEWRVDTLLMQYGLACEGSLDAKRSFAMGTFLWPDQL